MLLELLAQERCWSVCKKIRVMLTRLCRQHHDRIIAAARSARSDAERLWCLEALTAAKSPLVFDLWIEYFVNHSLAGYRATAAVGIRRLGDRRCAPYLQALTRDPAPSVRQTAVEALGAVRAPGMMSAVVDALADPERDVMRAAVYALKKFGAPGWDALLACVRANGPSEGRCDAVTWIVGGERSEPLFLQTLTDPLPELRIAALACLNSWGQRFASDVMRDAIGRVAAGDPVASVRRRAVLGLRWFATTEAAHAALIAALGDPDPDVRAMAIDSLHIFERFPGPRS